MHTAGRTSSILQPSTQSRVRAMASVSRCEISDAAGSAPSMEIKLHGSEMHLSTADARREMKHLRTSAFRSATLNAICCTSLAVQVTERQADARARGTLWGSPNPPGGGGGCLS